MKTAREPGIRNDDTIILYGDNNNWFAAYAYWLLKMYGHKDVRLMNGGRKKWIAETGADQRSASAGADELQVQTVRRIAPGQAALCLGEHRQAAARRRPFAPRVQRRVLAPPGMTETAQRAGHIPGATNVPWSKAVNEDGTFKSAGRAAATLSEGAGVEPDDEVITYCRIGERSSHTWFVLQELLGYRKGPQLRRFVDRVGQHGRGTD